MRERERCEVVYGECHFEPIRRTLLLAHVDAGVVDEHVDGDLAAIQFGSGVANFVET